jgi:hypothetical protein
MSGLDQSTVMAEYEGVELGDKRLDGRLSRIVQRLLGAPSDSFPEQMESDSDQEGLYRFLRNPKVTVDALLAPHQEQTLKRIAGRALVRIVHDTTVFAFDGDREGLGSFVGGGDQKGFLAHFALVLSADEQRVPLGILGLHPFIHEHKQRGMTRNQKQLDHLQTPRGEKKSSRWEKLALEVSAKLPDTTEAIHIMDKEADDYCVFSALLAEKRRFVIRAEAGRLTADRVPTDAFLARQEARFFRKVPLTARARKQATRQHPARKERLTELHVRAGTITLRRPQTARGAALPELSLQALHVYEPDPPDGETAVEWMLFTSEPVGSLQEIEAVVDHYRARWVIEEYFKALKTGCALEKRQLCSLDGLLRALALFVPMAWTLLTLRDLARDDPGRDATAVFTANQLRLLRALLEKRRRPFPAAPTVRDAMLGVAALGGHIKNNGDPGWLVLGRGFRRFCEAEEVWTIMLERSDQS